jgi:sterol desaturase/sphingolipid hydroxylase (fatty acid hydroxylase superfamily)
MDDIHGGDSVMQISDGQNPIHMSYEHHGLHHMSNGNGGGDSNYGGSENAER